MISEVNFRFIPGYLVYLLGAGLMVYGFAVVYSLARQPREILPADAPQTAFASGG